jgi:hypothetical protein
LVAAWVTVIATDAGLGGPVLTSSVLAQSEPEALDYSHVEIPFFQEWVGSGHADLTSEAFVHWQGDDPPLVSERCAACHSGFGALDNFGADGTPPGVDGPAEAAVLGCQTCHNEATVAKTEVEMPSGIVLTDLGREATCMTCHQGRASGATVQSAIEEAGVGWDEVMDGQRFINIHYYAAAGTLYGADAHAGYEYEGMVYDGANDHVEGYASCQSCHDPHSLEIDAASCSTCHWEVGDAEDLPSIRAAGSLVDYDGDGDIRTGIATEIDNLQHLLYETMQAYSEQVVGIGLIYDSHAYPYLFADEDMDGEADGSYGSFTPRLLAAAYNYQATLKDPGGYAHNPKYTIQLLHDSIMDLTSAMGGDMALVRPGSEDAVLAQASYDHADIVSAIPAMGHLATENLRRDDSGHFDATSEAWRHWDEDGIVQASCATCHSADGLPFFAQHGTQIAQPLSEGMECTTCHIDVDTGDFAMIAMPEVEFPSGAVLSFGDDGSNLCATCHQGRASTASVNARIGGAADDEQAEGLGFINVHYFAAAATRFGTEAMGGYEYADKAYVGFWPHMEEVAQCSACHDPHNQQVDLAGTCTDCHDGVETIDDVRALREWPGDWDGDGDTDEGTYYEIMAMEEMLYAAMQAYAADTVGTPIVYDSHAYPYFFVDTNGDGVPQADEANYGNQYRAWTPRLMRAAYNFQYVAKDTGGYVHNSQYLVQLLYDSLEDLGVDVSGMDRPAADLF